MVRMIQVEAEVPESRQVTVTLPPDVPTGRVWLTLTVEGSDVGCVPPYRPDNPALIPEHQAFHRMLPELVRTHHGKYVAVYQGRVVASGDRPDRVEQDVQSGYGEVPAYIGLVLPPATPGVVFSGVIRVVEDEPRG
jgi:hypothetical protein